jgi:hypothetical protein
LPPSGVLNMQEAVKESWGDFSKLTGCGRFEAPTYPISSLF